MTTYNSVSRNTTTFTEGLAEGRLTFLVTDTPDYILVGSAEDEYLVAWEDTSFSSTSRNTTTFNSVARN